MNKVIILGEESPDAPCEYCGKVSELRPYGKNGACICVDCGMANLEETTKNFVKVLDGTTEMPTDEQKN